jgi:hypothetical protein
VRKILDRLDSVLGRVFARVLGSICLLAGAAALVSGVLAIRAQGVTWGLLLPLAAGVGFGWLGIWLWRARRRLSDYDWSGV